MNTQIALKLAGNDLRLIKRDQTLIGIAIFAVVIAVGLRYLLPWMDGYLSERNVLPSDTISVRLSDVFPMIVAFFALFNGAQMSGIVSGFLLLDEKDQRTLRAMQVTPVPTNRLLLYRIVFPLVIGYLVCCLMLIVINQAVLPFWQALLISAGAACTAPIMTLYLATFSHNKVQGFAMSKFASIAGWTVLFGWFVSEPLQWLFGLFPPFLVSKAYWLALEGRWSWWLILIASIVLQIAIIVWLTQRFRQTVSD